MPTTSLPPAESIKQPPIQGRDEMHLADWPMSGLTRHQPREADGQKIDQVTYESSVYDRTSRRRIPQKVTLTTSSRYGLPTPADESVVLALLHVAKKTNDFTEARVNFVPRQLFRIMRWSPNSRSYDRLKAVLTRLRALDIRYENAWWDAEGKEYEAIFSTGIISEFSLLKPKVVRQGDALGRSFIHWSPAFFKSLASNHIKQIDLDLYFGLHLPTAQRMYRFLDKRFYTSTRVELDLIDFACGHIGLSKTTPPLLKQRLAPAIAELEAIGFLTSVPPQARYKKVKKGIWRISFEPGVPRSSATQTPTAQPFLPGFRPSDPSPAEPAEQLVASFYELWAPGIPPSDQSPTQAQDLIAKYGAALVESWLPKVIKRMKQDFPKAQHFGASLPFFAELAQEHADREQHEKRLEEQKRQRQREQQEADRQAAADQAFIDRWQPEWDALVEPDRELIRSAVFKTHAYLEHSLKLRNSSIATRLYLAELARQRSEQP